MKNNRSLRAFSLIEISIVILIIGILIAGITQSSRLVTQAKVNTAKSMTQASPVSSVSGLSFWIESADILNFNANIDDGDQVTTWKDINSQIGIKSNLATGNGTPLYTSDGINGIPAVTFAADSSLTSTGLPNIATGKVTIFAVVESTSESLAAGTIFSKGDNIALATTSDGWSFSGGGATYTAAASNVSKVPYVVSFVFHNTSAAPSSATTSGYNFFNNGTAGFSGATTANLDALETDSFTLGAATGGFVGKVGEIIIYNRAVKKSERQDIEAYLGKKWGIDVVKAAY